MIALPTRTSGLRRAAAPRGVKLTFTSRGGSTEPRVTPRNMPIFRVAVELGQPEHEPFIVR